MEEPYGKTEEEAPLELDNARLREAPPDTPSDKRGEMPPDADDVKLIPSIAEGTPVFVFDSTGKYLVIEPRP